VPSSLITPRGGWHGDVFFHKSSMAGGVEPTVDMVVQFAEELDPRSGRTRAANVRPV
jgi:hypothetical protein